MDPIQELKFEEMTKILIWDNQTKFWRNIQWQANMWNIYKRTEESNRNLNDTNMMI